MSLRDLASQTRAVLSSEAVTIRQPKSPRSRPPHAADRESNECVRKSGVGGVGVAWAHASDNTLQRLILRAVLRNVSPMVIPLVSVSDRTDLHGLHDVFHAILGWSGDLGYLVRVHGQEFNSFRRSTRSKALRDFQLHAGRQD